jgi:hypothetical protein
MKDNSAFTAAGALETANSEFTSMRSPRGLPIYLSHVCPIKRNRDIPSGSCISEIREPNVRDQHQTDSIDIVCQTMSGHGILSTNSRSRNGPSKSRRMELVTARAVE